MFQSEEVPGRAALEVAAGAPRDAVAMVLDEERSIADVVRSVGVSAGTLVNRIVDDRTGSAGDCVHGGRALGGFSTIEPDVPTWVGSRQVARQP